MMRPAVEIHHLSSRYDRSPRTLRSALNRSRRLGATIITVTEVDRPRRTRALWRWARWRGWVVVQDRTSRKTAETALLVDARVWIVRRQHTHVIGPDDAGRPVLAVMALLAHRASGRKLLVSTSHLLSSVEGAWAGRRAARHRDHVEAWRQANRRWRERHRPDAEVAVADWNLDLRRPWVREWVRGAWPGMRTPPRIPRVGTHGPRLIDWPLVRGVDVIGFDVLDAHPHSDHRGIRLRVRVQ
jgi:hypothetical protein